MTSPLQFMDEGRTINPLSQFCSKGVKSIYKKLTGDTALDGEGLSAFLLRPETRMPAVTPLGTALDVLAEAMWQEKAQRLEREKYNCLILQAIVYTEDPKESTEKLKKPTEVSRTSEGAQ